MHCLSAYCSRAQLPKSRTLGVAQMSRPVACCARSRASNSAVASSAFGAKMTRPAAAAANKSGEMRTALSVA
jgi:hypothetical protein